MRLISCSLTEPQIVDRSKTETRRLGWDRAKVGDILCWVDKCMGFKKGQKPRRICLAIVTDTWREPLNAITDLGAVREGFPMLSGGGFTSMFCCRMRCDATQSVRVIQFKYIPGGRS